MKKRANLKSDRGDLTTPVGSRKADGNQPSTPWLVVGGRAYPEDELKEVTEVTFHGRFVLTPRRLLVAFIIVAATGLAVGGKVGLLDTVSTIIKALVQARGG